MTTLEVVIELKESVLKMLELKADVRMLDVYDAFDSVFELKYIESPDILAYKIAHEVVVDYRGRGILRGYSIGGYENNKQFFDELILALQTKHVLSVNTYGTDSTVAQNVYDALEAARMHRSSLIYIRPPSAFLRSS
jgi:hypothetical protein